MAILLIYLSVYVGLFGIASVKINVLLHCFTVRRLCCMIVWWDSCRQSSLAWRSSVLRWQHCAALCGNRKRMWAYQLALCHNSVVSASTLLSQCSRNSDIENCGNLSVVSKMMSWFKWLLLVLCVCPMQTFCLFFFFSHLQNDVLCVEWDIQLYSISSSSPLIHRETQAADSALPYHTTLSSFLQVIFNFTISFSSAMFCVFFTHPPSLWSWAVYVKDRLVILLLDFLTVWLIQCHFWCVIVRSVWSYPAQNFCCCCRKRPVVGQILSTCCDHLHNVCVAISMMLCAEEAWLWYSTVSSCCS